MSADNTLHRTPDTPWLAHIDRMMQAGAEPDVPAATPHRERLRLGIFGGTFDPVHIGHLLLAQEAAFHLPLDRVYFLPAGCPPHKPGQAITPVRHRLAMAALATRSNPLFAVSRLDCDEARPSYTADLMRRIQAQVQDSAELFFLMGMDSLHDLPTWHEPDWLLQHCNLVALNRPDIRIDWTRLEQRLPHIRQRVQVVAMPDLNVSGLNVRERFRARQPVRYLLQPQVIRYIRTHRLYASEMA